MSSTLEALSSLKKGREEAFAAQKEALSKLSDEELIAKKHGQVENSEIHVIAVQLLHERQQVKDRENQEALLAAIKKPHWSVVPAFALLVLSVILVLIGLAKPYLEGFLPQQPVQHTGLGGANSPK